MLLLTLYHQTQRLIKMAILSSIIMIAIKILRLFQVLNFTEVSSVDEKAVDHQVLYSSINNLTPCTECFLMSLTRGGAFFFRIKSLEWCKVQKIACYLSTKWQRYFGAAITQWLDKQTVMQKVLSSILYH